MQPAPAEVLDFWFAPATQPHWFAASPAFDAECVARLGGLHERAIAGDLDAWSADASGSLALVLLLDQYPRNAFRGQARAFASDPLALALTRSAVDRGLDHHLDQVGRVFLYLPLEHSESLADQQRCVDLMRALENKLWLDYAVRHLEIIARFGRFPHRNAVLGRASTPEELEFLKQPGSSF
ncbi:MAG: DUF924 domain-containing protein [Nannocystis sp.]|nr:DUF924 domain-containing protein [Nannocystis sp.]